MQVVHLMHMFRLGLEFASTPHGYVVHSPHPVANSWNTTQATGFWYKVRCACCGVLWCGVHAVHAMCVLCVLLFAQQGRMGRRWCLDGSCPLPATRTAASLPAWPLVYPPACPGC